MKLNIRAKLILAITTLIVVLFSLVAVLLINEKKTEIAEDIYVNGLAFAKLSAPKVAESYDLYLAESGFVYYNREIKDIFAQNDDVGFIKVVTFAGSVLYDSQFDTDKRFEGRRSADEELLAQVQSEYVSVKTGSGDVLYLKDGKFSDYYGKPVEPLKQGELIEFLVVPTTERYSIVYGFDYHNLNRRVADMIRRIVLLAVFGVLLGIVFSVFLSQRVTKPVAKLVKGAESIAKGDFAVRVEVDTEDEIGFLGGAFNQMAGDLEESVEARVYKERVAHELGLATEIQKQIVPKSNEIPRIGGLEIAAGLIPAEEIGGDIYDFLKTSEDRMVMYLGDVTGHGVPAGLVSSITSALFYGYSFEADLKKMMMDVNRVLKAKTMPTMFVTLCLLEWKAGILNYVSAGHEQLIHFSNGKAGLCPSGGVALGMLDSIEGNIKISSVDFRMGDYVVLYSDGIPECWNAKKERYGMERLISKVGELATQGVSARELKLLLLKDLQNFADGYPQQDDVTLIVLKRI